MGKIRKKLPTIEFKDKKDRKKMEKKADRVTVLKETIRTNADEVVELSKEFYSLFQKLREECRIIKQQEKLLEIYSNTQ